MIKGRLRFVLPVMLVSVFFFSCASDDAAETYQSEETVPVVEVESAEPEFSVDDTILPEPEQNIALAEDEAKEEPAVETVQTEEFVLVEEYIENEFVPVEEEPQYTIDIVAYYDDFSVAENEFVDVEPPVFEETEPVMPETLVAVPAEEEIRKPVVIITEEEAVASSEREKEIALSELESILENVPDEDIQPSLIPSRSVVIHKNDILDVPYQGNWWVYLGDAGNSNALVFMGRDYVSDKTVFTLRAVKEGTALLHFFKQDIIGGVMIDDYLEVTVEESAGVSEKITLDEFIISQMDVHPSAGAKDAVDYVQVKTETVAAPQETSTEAPVLLTEVPLETKTGIVSEENEVTSVDEVILNPDEDLFMRAQELEKTDIEGALELYRRLVSDYPASPYWNQANKRITYINRFYFFKR